MDTDAQSEKKSTWSGVMYKGVKNQESRKSETREVERRSRSGHGYSIREEVHMRWRHGTKELFEE